ncbi:UNVERIFIED_CONTAM: hypothetical protein Scaly_2671700 [Sesamum calycinum]|uniref:Uncharacterized protein n=1 Tax=Sesamum calycinum TaxID=2727403 RepID=A0AAW2J831_9LAMI
MPIELLRNAFSKQKEKFVEIGMIFSNKVELRNAFHSQLAKKKALNAIQGKAEDQFDSLWDYATELRSSNPGSIVQMVMNDGEDGTGQRKFLKFYVCFDALRRGFLFGCSHVIGVDSCHLKGLCGGVFLTAVSIDPNNNLYPLAYAMVARDKGIVAVVS